MYWKTKNRKKTLPKAERKPVGRSWRVKPKKDLPETKSEHELGNNPRTFSLGNTGIRHHGGKRKTAPIPKPVVQVAPVEEKAVVVEVAPVEKKKPVKKVVAKKKAAPKKKEPIKKKEEEVLIETVHFNINMKKTELVSIAKSVGISTTGLTKQDIVEALTILKG